ncbi:hypothetical protein LOK49_LG04G00324 [Camellia lanceoleosa]|uniref:Uncharacterized protein n=1 Tax=Camellia lanceoleosa TaxID=1840588 RepID=A0ACC0I6P8_9ERIC|nr:hypothetical protein LOK49_LG04G00324 [Camellia lanceoleosa]
MEDSVTSPSHDNIVKETLSETLLYESKSIRFKELEEKSPRDKRQIGSGQDLKDQSYSSRSQSRLVDSGSLKCVSTPSRHRYSPKNDRRRDTLESTSPVRRRDSFFGYKRDYSNRSQSMSPHTRNHHRRSLYTRNHYKRSPRGGILQGANLPLHAISLTVGLLKGDRGHHLIIGALE